jgi:hypothetical protein
MHAAGKLGRERCVDHAVTFDSALSPERFRHDIKPEVSLAARPVAGVASVKVRFIFDT